MKTLGYLFIISLVSLLIPSNAKAHNTKPVVASAHVKMFQTAIETFKLNHGRYPTENEGLEVLLKGVLDDESGLYKVYVRKLPHDPWGQPYQYKQPGLHNPDSYDLWSFGADGQSGGEGINRDCGNWERGRCHQIKSNGTDYLERGLLLVISPLFWFPVYVVCSIYFMVKGNGFNSALVGRHLDIFIWSVPIYFVVALLTIVFGSHC